MPLERINIPTFPDPGGNYHHVVKDGNTLYLSGLVGYDEDRNLPSDPAGQIENAFKNVQSALTFVGSDMRHITKWTVYMTTSAFPGDYPTVQSMRAKYIPDDSSPAGTLIVVAGLASPDMCIELDVIATMP